MTNRGEAKERGNFSPSLIYFCPFKTPFHNCLENFCGSFGDISLCVYTQARTLIHTCPCIHTNTHGHVHLCRCVLTCAYAQVYIHTDTHLENGLIQHNKVCWTGLCGDPVCVLGTRVGKGMSAEGTSYRAALYSITFLSGFSIVLVVAVCF